MIRFLTILALTLSLHVAQAQHRPIALLEGQGGCEPSIKIDPNNTNRIVAGAVLNHIFHSDDGGESWGHEKITSTYGVWGDPVIDVDTAGHFYFFHLSRPDNGSWIDRIVCQTSADGGRSWDNGSYTGLNDGKEQDKHWTAVDPRNNVIHMTWTEFDDYGNESDTCMSRIRYSYSEDQGKTWTDARTISTIPGDCKDDDETVEGAMPAIGPDGEIYVCWAGPSGLTFVKSYDQGDNWTSELLIDPLPGGWTYAIPRIYRANGLPVTKVDLSGGGHHGRIYVNWSDQREGTTDTDVWLAYSDDEGLTWSDPKTVHYDPDNTHQFFTWMDVDQVTGVLYFVYYDRKAFTENPTATYVHMSMSIDGGDTFHDFPLLKGPEASFIPDKKIFFGDYNNVSVHDGVVRPIWTRLHDGKLSVWTCIVDNEQLDDRLFHFRPQANYNQKDEVCLLLFRNGKKKQVLDKRSSGEIDFSVIWGPDDTDKGTYQAKLMSGKEVLWSSKEYTIGKKAK